MASSRIRVVGGVLLGLILFISGAHLTADFRPEDAALGPFTFSRGAVFDGRTVSFQNADSMQVARDLVTEVRREGGELALWLGASHQYAINGFQPGNENAVFHANRLARERDAALTYLGFGLPNGNFNEFLATYLHFREAKLLPNRLIVGALYDDLREPGLRPRIRELIADVPVDLLAGLGAAGDHLLAAQAEAPPPVERNAMDGTPQQAIESRIVGWMEQAWAPFANRHRLSAWIGWRWRRAVFDVGEALRQVGAPTRQVPPVPEAMQRWNEAAMVTLLQLAVADGVEVLVYKVPHPPTTGPFYHDRTRYDDFHRRLRTDCQQMGATYLDLEGLIELPYWMFDSTIDHWHFQEPGHVLLAEALDAALAGGA